MGSLPALPTFLTHAIHFAQWLDLTLSQQVDLFLLFILLIILAYTYRPKYFYIVRHGETLLNQQHVKQGAEGGLSQKGKEQARAVALAFTKEGISKIYSSPYERALETARIIKEELHCPIKETPLLAERRNPSEVIGKPTDDPEVERITSLTAYGYHEDDYRFSDEENFQDLAARAAKCLRFLTRRPGHRIALVTHHAFLQMLLSYLLYRDALDARGYVKLSFFNPAENAGITICVYHPWHNPFSKRRGWEIRTYSQQA